MCKDIDNALAVAEALIRAAGRGRVGFKLRLGWDEPGRSPAAETWRVLAPALEALGAGWLTLHPRTAKQGFTGTARWEYLSELKALVSLPVIASGDLFTAEDGVRCLAETGVDTVMYARGALRDPAIFKAHLDLLAGREPDAARPHPGTCAARPETQHGKGGAAQDADHRATLRPAHRRFETAQGGYHCLPELGRF